MYKPASLYFCHAFCQYDIMILAISSIEPIHYLRLCVHNEVFCKNQTHTSYTSSKSSNSHKIHYKPLSIAFEGELSNIWFIYMYFLYLCMRIVHFMDIAGISSILSKYMNHIYGYRAKVLYRHIYDPYCITAHYFESCRLAGSLKSFYVNAALMSIGKNIIHYNMGMNYVGLIKRISGGAKVIFHYHGSDARDNPYESRMSAEKLADCILVSTPDLLDETYRINPIYVPNPVDTELFSPRDIPDNNRGLVFMKPGQRSEHTLQRLCDLGYGDIQWDLVPHTYDTQVIGNIKLWDGIEKVDLSTGDIKRIPYSKMPAILSRYKYYGDIQWNANNDTAYNVDSTTGLQAMSLGLTVIRHDGSTANNLPAQHMPKEATRRVKEIYEGLMKR